MKIPTLQTPHYSNYLMVSKDGKPLATINKKRFDWYLKKNLAHEIEWPDKNYGRAIKLNFETKSKEHRQSDITVVEEKCVVCGTKELLSLHHVVPHRVKKFYPKQEKNHTRHLCVLLCEKHHTEIERMNDTLITNPVRDFERMRQKILKPIEGFLDIFRKIHMKLWIRKHGGIPKINKVFIDKFLEMKPQHLPKGWL